MAHEPYNKDLFISIHAPTRGATLEVLSFFRQVSIFQSTLLQEERHNSVVTANLIQIFQSTLLQEERPRWLHNWSWLHRFQSTLLQEERLTVAEIKALAERFQSTLLQEERRFHMRIMNQNSYFNPRSYKRSDGKNAQLSLYLSVIIIA